MKRTFCAVMAVLLTFSLMLSAVSCTLFENADFVNEAVNTVLASDQVSVSLKKDVYVSGDATEMLTQNAELGMSKLQTTAPIFSAQTSVTLFEEIVPASVYFENGTYYVVTASDSVQITAENAEEEYDLISVWKSMTKTFSETALKNAVLTTNDNGTKTAELLLDAGEFAALYEDMLAEWHLEIVRRYVGTYESSDMTATDTKAKVIVDENGKLLSYELFCRMSIDATNAVGETKKFSALLTYIADYNDATMVTPPEGYLDFEVSDGKKPNPYAVMKKAVEGALALDDWNAVMSMESVMDMMGAQLKMTMSSTVLATGVQTGAPVFHVISTSDSMGITDKEEIYFADGYYYVDSAISGKIKYTAEEGRESYDAITDIRDLVKVLSETDMKNAVLTKNEDGTKTITLMLFAARAGELYGNVFGSEGENISVSDMDVTLVIDREENLISYTIGGTFAMDSEGYTFSIPITYAVAFSEYGKTVSPEPMAGYESYPLLSEKNGDAFAAVNEAIENFLSTDAFNLYYAQESYTDLAGTTSEVVQEATVSAKDLNSSAKYRYELTSKMMGMTFTEDVYYENGNFYITSPILGDSLKISAAEAPTYNILALPAAVIQTLPDALALTAETEYDDGLHYIYAELSEELFESMFPVYEAQITDESIGYPIAKKNFAWGYVEAMSDDAGHLIYFNVVYAYEIQIYVMGQYFDVYATVDAYFEPDMISEVTVEAPENYKNFTEYSGSVIA